MVFWHSVEGWKKSDLSCRIPVLTGHSHHHITTLFLNAGMGPYIGFNVHLWAKSLATRGIIATFSRPGTWTIEEMGQMSADGERGMAWGVNVLASYILVGHSLSRLD